MKEIEQNIQIIIKIILAQLTDNKQNETTARWRINQIPSTTSRKQSAGFSFVLQWVNPWLNDIVVILSPTYENGTFLMESPVTPTLFRSHVLTDI